MAAQKFLTDQEARDVLTICLDDGGSLYWIERVIDSQGADGRAVFDACPANGPRQRFRITPAMINDAALKLIMDRAARSDILGDVANREFDQTSADCVLQLATFGEIVYG